MQARASTAATRDALVARAQATLRQTTELRLGDGSLVPVSDAALADRITSAEGALDGAIAALSGLADVAQGAPLDEGAADARLKALVGEERTHEAQVSLTDLLSRSIARWLAGLRGSPPDVRVLIVAAGATGLALLALVLAILGRDVRERFRREVVLPDLVVDRRLDPALHLRRAEEALRSGAFRDAIHALYLYAIAALAARDLVRFDPSLTDGELLARARAIPHASALRDLVALHDRVWYGLRGARPEDATRARALALEAAT